MPAQPRQHAIVQSVERSRLYPLTHPFLVTGLLIKREGNVECFAWHLPDLEWSCFDWSQFSTIRPVARVLYPPPLLPDICEHLCPSVAKPSTP